MNAAEQMIHCPPHQTLSAFMEGQLPPDERDAVVAHVAGCAECRDVLITRNALSREQVEDTPLAPVVPFRRRGWVVPSNAAAAAVAAVLFLSPADDWIVQKYRLRQLASAVESLDKRPIEARTSLSTAHRQYFRPRGNGDSDPRYGVLAAAGRVAADAEKKPTVSNLHAAGIAHLMLENTQDVDYKKKGVELLEEALKEQTGQPGIDQAIAASTDADLLNDLAAGYHAIGDGEQAVKAIGRAWQLRKSETTAWTRAVILRTDDAWRDYLSLDATSPWSAEARAHLEPSVPD
jgi:hypothetical protein